MMFQSESDDDTDSQFQSPWALGHDHDGGQYEGSDKEAERGLRGHDSYQATSRGRHQKSIGWEIIEGVKEDTEAVEHPPAEKGVIYRRRKWPMKGWSKIYIAMESGIMAYSKSSSQFSKRHFSGEIDLGLAVVTYKSKRHRIDIDADTTFYHLKVKEADMFDHWVSTIRRHRLYRQWKLMRSDGNDDGDGGITDTSEVQESEKTFSAFGNMVATISTGNLGERRGVLRQAGSSPSVDKITPELVRTLTLAEESHEDAPSTALVLIDEDIKLIQAQLEALSDIVQEMDLNVRSDSPSMSASNPSLAGSKKSPSNGDLKPLKPVSLLLSPNIPQLRMGQFASKANEVLLMMQSTSAKILQERDHLVLGNGSGSRRENSLPKNVMNVVKELIQQNSDLRARLARILTDASVPYTAPTVDVSTFQGSVSASTTDDFISDNAERRESRNTSAVTAPETFYDAAEFLNSDSASSISETEDIDELSDVEEEIPVDTVVKRRTQTLYQEKTGRRDKLPAVQPDSSQFSLMNLLCKNIGRDLSKVRLPVILNEPLSVLQMLCEGFEYSDVLDVAANCSDPLERMQYLAAFAVSGYASTVSRAGTKPFNPLIGETYEYVRPDKGWKYIAEQVSHHPPISVCHCESDTWVLWQDFRLKNKFWGKSIEAVPTGSLRVTFKKFNETVTWNKVTTCIYNIFGQNRYVEHYGDMHLAGTSGASAKITFHKSGSWTHQRYEVSGWAQASPSGPRCPLFGKWTQGLYVGEEARCVWRPGTAPADADRYYGFSVFATDLNNPEEEILARAAATDSRHRPDQRLLEMGLVAEAEAAKTRVEELQRARLAAAGGDAKWTPMWFRRAAAGQDFEFAGEYWRARASGFQGVDLPRLW